MDLKLWKNGYLNLFDWPFALIRWMSDYDTELAPLGGTFPTFLLSLERVDPGNDPISKMLGDSTSFNRFKSEIAFRTPLSSLSFVEVNLRYYRRLNPPTAIKQANMDAQFYFTAALIAPNGLFVSYTTGRLPFDDRDDKVYAIGLRYNF